LISNLFDDIPAASRDEVVTTLLARDGAQIERIVSTGQSTPLDAPYDQDYDEWVVLLRGAAGLWIDGEAERATARRPRADPHTPRRCACRSVL